MNRTMKYGWIAGLLAFAMLISGWCTVAVADENSPYLTGTFTLPSNREHSVQNLTDDNDRTRLTLTSGQSMDVEWNGEAEGILICWYNTDNRVTISLFDEMEGILRKTEYRETPYRMFIPAASARKLTITCEKNNMASICELRVCRAGYVPSCVTEQPDWDLMLVLSSTSEETDLLGGLLPLYAGEHGIRTGIIYIGIDYGYRVQEAFRALQTMGLDITPVFLRMDEQATCSIDRMGYFWSENKLKEQLVGLMNRYRPKVVVTCDPDDTVSMVRAPYTARLMDSIIRQYSQRGELSVQKFYQLSDKGTTHMNWTTPLVTYQGRTAQEVAKAGYACYQTESSYGTIIPSSTTFRLAYSSVGEDVLCNDLMEHIDLDTLLVYQVPTPTPMPTLTPTVMPTEEPIVEPTDSPVSTPSPKAHSTIVPTEEASTVSLTQQQTTSTGWGYLWIILVLLAIVGGIVFVTQKKVTFAIIAGCIAIMLLLLGIRTMRAPSGEGELKKGTEQEQPVKPTDSPTAELTEKPIEKPTEKPTTIPTVEPTATPDPTAQYYRQPGEADEVIVSNYEDGHWEYRTDTLSILIDRTEFQLNGHPQCKYVAHIRMREINSFRAAVSSNYDKATAAEPPWRLARNYRAVLAITGDNLNNAEESLKGILIRNGNLYSDRNGAETLLIDDDLTMRILPKGEISGVDLLDRGVLNTFSFGPVLVENGKVNPEVGSHRIAWGNPRCGIGYVAPGHFVAIVTDGRDARRAYNLRLEEFAELFAELGVECAYNLDGGSSAAMVFMGEHINWHSGDPQRTWADALVWGYSCQVPLVTDPIVHTGDGGVY